MHTKERILDAARKLFNAKGVSAVSVRDLCRVLGISTGNFTYHYPDKDEIVVQLYKNMVGEIKAELGRLITANISIVFHLELHKKLFTVQSRYKFIYLNLFEIVTSHPEIKRIYRRNNKTERKFAAEMLHAYIKAGVIKPDTSGDRFEQLINTGQIISNTWLVDAEILYASDRKRQLIHYMSICCGLMVPVLTAAALREYNNYFADLENRIGKG